MKVEKDNIKISVIIPTYNEEKSIAKLIEALLSQSFPPSEIIINDNHSKDKTISIISSYIEKNKNIKLISRQGICRGAGRNEAANHSKYPYLAFIDAGIIPDKDWLLNFVNHCHNKNYDIIFGSVYFVTTNIFEESYASTFFDKSVKKNYIMPSVASMFINKIIWKNLKGFPESIDGSYAVEDLRFINIIKKSKHSILYESKARVNWIINLNLITLFKRFLNNSFGGLKSGFYHTWHKGLFRNMIIFTLLLICANFFSNFFYLLIVFLLLLKSFFYLRFTDWFLKNSYSKKFLYLICTSLIFVIIDVASFMGFVKWIFSGLPRSKDIERLKNKS